MTADGNSKQLRVGRQGGYKVPPFSGFYLAKILLDSGDLSHAAL